MSGANNAQGLPNPTPNAALITLAGDVAGAANANAIKASVALTGNPTAATQAATDSSTRIASTAYVTTGIANAVAGVNPAVAVQAATTAASDTSTFTYANGVAGIGATLTGPTANTAVTIDGYTFTALGQRLLVKNDTQAPSGAFNGVYFLTTLQAPLIKPVFTRALDYDTPSDINNTGAIPVVSGTANANTSWLLTSSVTTVGTDPLTYTQFSIAPSNLPRLATLTLSSAQLLSIFTTPVTVIPAPGAGLAICPIYCMFNYTFVTTAYSDPGGNLSLTLDSNNSNTFFTIATATGFWTAASSQLKLNVPRAEAVAVSAWANKPVTVQQNTGNPALGDGTVTVTVSYLTIPVA